MGICFHLPTPLHDSVMLNCALIGCGRVAPRHAESITELSGLRLAAVVDAVESRAQHFAGKYESTAYTDYRDVLDQKDIDLVTIATPSGMHAQMAVDAMEAGKHVLVEKPIALTLADADRMIATSERTGLLLGVVHQNRFNPPMIELRRLVDSGGLGKILLGSATVRWYRPQEYYEDGWHGTIAMDGGALMNQSIHHIDALQWLMGGEIDSIFAFTGTLAHRMEAEDTGVGVLRFRGGALGSIEGSTITYPENLEGSVALFGERGSVKVGGTALNAKEFWKVTGEIEHEREMLTTERVNPPSVYGFSHKKVISLMGQAITDGAGVPTSAVEARKPLAVVLAMYEASRTGMAVDMSRFPWTTSGAANAR